MSEENSIIEQRREKLQRWRDGGAAYPNDFRRDAMAAEMLDAHADKEKDALEEQGIAVKMAGRLMSRRIMGKASFAHIADDSGTIQLFLQRDNLPEGQYNDEFKSLDIGDIIGVGGTLFKTKTGELSVRVEALQLLTKSLRPLPEKYHGLTDAETRYRQRYVDLMVNEESRRVFLIRTKAVKFIRDFMAERGFLEVETPMMHPIPGGAVARPFTTHHNTLDMPLFMRVAPELYLKRLVVGGFERVFEINRNFRNEGISTRHNPEFTMMEFYWAYADYHELMDLTETMLRELVESVCGSKTISYQGDELDFSMPFQRLTMAEAVLQYNPELSAEQLQDCAALEGYLQKLGAAVPNGACAGKLLTEVFENTVEDKLHQPTFITEYPVAVSPLSRRNDDNADVSDRFEFFVTGRELANGFSELNDPEDQAERFAQQVAEKDAGDQEAMHFDADYIRALEYGLPPTAGEGIGIDRLVMMLTDSASIRDVILFPLMRPEVL